MVQGSTNPVWAKWESHPTVFSLEEVHVRWKSQLAEIQQAGVLHPTIAASYWWCHECCDNHEILYHDFPTGRHALVSCRAGAFRLTSEQTSQVSLDTSLMLGWLFASSRVLVQPIVAKRLWNIGRHTVAGRSLELLFARGDFQTIDASVITTLAKHAKAITFTPSRGSAGELQNRVSGLVVALEEVVDPTITTPLVNWPVIEEKLFNHFSLESETVQPKKKRGTRTAKIERLRDEIKRHLASAADHAIATSESESGITLLPRPTKTQLAKLAGMSKYDVTRCFADPTATELRLLWDTADDLEAVLRLRGRSAP